MNEHEKYSAGADARRTGPRHAWRPDEPLRQDALMRYLGAIAAVSASKGPGLPPRRPARPSS